jgi:hypothetical protein
MLPASSRRMLTGAEILALMLFGGLLATGQSVTSQSPSVQSSSGQPVSSQPLSDQSAPNQDSSSHGSSGQSSPGQSSLNQSLGDIARANQQKKAEATTPPKKITNADIPKNPEGYTGPPAEEEQNAEPSRADEASSRHAAQQRAAEGRAAAQWRQRIEAQQDRVANLEARVDRLRARVRRFDPNASSDYNAIAGYNGGQTRVAEQLHQMEDQLGLQKQKLEQMQEAARHAGMHTNVYDP